MLKSLACLNAAKASRGTAPIVTALFLAMAIHSAQAANVNRNIDGSTSGVAGAFSASPGSANAGIFCAGTDAAGSYTIAVGGTTAAPLFADSLSFSNGTRTLTGGVTPLTKADGI